MYLNIILANPPRHKYRFKDEIIHVKSVAYVEEMKSHVPDKPPFRDVIFVHPIDRDDRYVGDFIEMQEGDTFRVYSDSGVLLKEYKK